MVTSTITETPRGLMHSLKNENKEKSSVQNNIALQALRAINKSYATALKLETIPDEILLGETIDLKRWTLIISDENLKKLSLQNAEYTGESKDHSFIDADKPSIIGMLDTFWTKRYLPKGLLSLNISNAPSITDYGLALIARSSPKLKELTINGCSTLGDAGNYNLSINFNVNDNTSFFLYYNRVERCRFIL